MKINYALQASDLNIIVNTNAEYTLLDARVPGPLSRLYITAFSNSSGRVLESGIEVDSKFRENLKEQEGDNLLKKLADRLNADTTFRKFRTEFIEFKDRQKHQPYIRILDPLENVVGMIVLIETEGLRIGFSMLKEKSDRARVEEIGAQIRFSIHVMHNALAIFEGRFPELKARIEKENKLTEYVAFTDIELRKGLDELSVKNNLRVLLEDAQRAVAGAERNPSTYKPWKEDLLEAISEYKNNTSNPEYREKAMGCIGWTFITLEKAYDYALRGDITNRLRSYEEAEDYLLRAWTILRKEGVDIIDMKLTKTLENLTCFFSDLGGLDRRSLNDIREIREKIEQHNAPKSKTKRVAA